MRHLAAALLLASALATPALASENYGPRLVHLAIVDPETGKEKPVYYHDRHYFIAGTQGRRYALRMVNETNGRVEVVLTVDGVNVSSGETGDVHQHDSFVLEPHQSWDIPGWMKNHSEAAAFRFSPMAQSYAARTGRPGNVGVIGMAVYQEKYVPPPPSPPPPPPSMRMVMPAPAPDVAVPYRSTDAISAEPPPNQPMNAAPPPAQTEKLGTAHGERVDFATREVDFTRATRDPVELRLVDYDSLGNLIAAGIVAANTRDEDRPNPFPGSDGGQHFVPDPPPG